MRKILMLALSVLLLNCQSKQESNDYLLHYSTPATNWETQALAMGNGYIGAMFFGGVDKEQIQFSEGTLWSGGKNSNPDYNYGIQEKAYKHLPQARKLIRAGKFEQAHKFVQKHFAGAMEKDDERYNSMFGDYGAQQTMGDVFVMPKHGEAKISDYHRELNISKSLSKVSYKADGKQFTRTYFANYPSNVLVYRFASTEPTDYTVNLSSPHKITSTKNQNKQLVINGEVKDNGMKFQTILDFNLSDGEIVASGDKVLIMGAKNLIIKHVAATEYTLNFPNYDGNDFVAQNKKSLKKAADYNSLLKEHLADYTALFNRFSLKLGTDKTPKLTTEQRLEAYAKGQQDNYLEELFLQFNRYLMISGSRPNTMSMHLQGKWNNSTNPPWSADYHSNINLEMIYWPAELTNLSECHLPYLDYTKSLVEPGKLAAKAFFNTRGWMVNTMCNAFGYTSIGWGIPWGYFPAGAAWMSQHLYDHYDFNNDINYLKNHAFPIMKEAALFWVDYLVKDENGKLVSMPSYSPEHGTISAGASMDQQIVWDLFHNIEKAAKVLKIEDDFTKEITQLKAQLLEPQIGKWGQLMEWKEDVDDPKSKHRHVSHLFAVHPGHQITPSTTPELAKAAAVSLNARGDGGTGWSKSWKINFWARLKDAERAYKMLREAMKLTDSSSPSLEGGGVYRNLFCTHPPFQLDGNMGATSGIVEMLVQSHAGELELLPALPGAWQTGSIKGVKARGGLTLDIQWQASKVTKLKIQSPIAQTITLRHGGTAKEITLKAGENKIL